MMTILLVDDSRFQRLANERSLTKAGYSVISASDGESALRIAHERSLDLILLDMMLPKLDGISVLRALKHEACTANIPVIVLSGLPHKNEAKLIEEGASGYIEKSESLQGQGAEILLKMVATVLHNGAVQAASAKV
jgi:CheY-like chemotaxis protein